MTNDTTTLNGALTELGELMADNLVTMGVTDAQASDGLTTLANKVLDIQGGGSESVLTLTGNKSKLSSFNSDTLTLTATLTGGTVSGQTIEFFNGTTSMGTATTNSSGVATMTYSSSGVGEIYFTATKGSVSSKPLKVLDAKFYASNDTIDSQAQTFSDHTATFLNYPIQYRETVYFKFNTKPTHCLIGIGSSSTSGFIWEFNTNSSQVHRNYGANTTYSYNLLDTYDEIGIETQYNGTRAMGNLYRDRVYWDYWQFNMTSAVQKLRVDKYPNDDYDIEVIVL